MTEVRALVAGNWKMNGLRASANEASELADLLRHGDEAACDVLLCPPFTLLMPFSHILEGSGIELGAQDCHRANSGPHTGDIGAPMLRDAGCEYVIVGHSERRTNHGEDSQLVGEKARAAHEAGLTAIICVGESRSERKAGRTLDVVDQQLQASIPGNSRFQNTVIAYEPVWAIGSGETPSRAEISEVHAFIHKRLANRFGGDGASMRILYGGSVTPKNARDLMSIRNVNGALVGGASLRAIDLNGIIEAYR